MILEFKFLYLKKIKLKTRQPKKHIHTLVLNLS